jgi:RNA polymerase sigma-70 factor (ECF subfamily)
MGAVTTVAPPRPALSARYETGSVIVDLVEVGDRVLAARLAAGDDDALDEVFDRYAGFLLGVARRVTGSTALAEDVVQEVLAALWRNPERFDPARGSLRAYLGVMAHRRAVDALRRDSRRRAREEQSGVLDPAFGRRPDDMDRATLGHVVRSAIARLPDEQRKAVELAFWQGRTYREVASVLGIPEGTAKSRLRLAQAKLAQWLAPVAAEAIPGATP